MTHASLFSGIGGSEVAAAALGWQNLFHCDIDDFCRQILEYWFPKSKSYKDVKETDFAEWRGTIDVLTGGFPCQPFSTAGKRRGAEDNRYLWPEFIRVVKEIQPRWVVGENVVGILTMVEPGCESNLESETTLFDEENNIYKTLYIQRFTIEKVCSELGCSGYEVQPVIIPACAVGAPHRRDRVFIVAHAVSNGAGRKTGSEKGKERAQRLQQLDGANKIFPTSENSNGMGSRAVEKLEYDKRQRYTGTTGRNGDVADTNGKRLESGKFCNEEIHGKNKREFEYKDGIDGQRAGWERWAQFSAQPPVCGRNDGLPFDVDDLSISFNQWRTKSLKAYGNAIVPQVIYEIFRAIDILENNG